MLGFRRALGMKLWTTAFISLAALSAGCSSGGIAPPQLGAPLLARAHKKTQHVHWTLYAGRTYPQVQGAKIPLRAKSKTLDLGGSEQNDLNYTSGMTVDKSGHLWVLSFGKYGGNPVTALVFDLPLKASSLPKYSFVLSGTDGSNALAFDPSGNLWASSPGNNEVLEYSGPFTKSGTLSPALTFDGGDYQPYGIAFDRSAILYISIFNSTGTNSIAVAAPPYTSGPYFLDGLTSPGSLTFDAAGNLYSSSNGSSGAAVVRYDADNLKKGAKPSIVDPTGLPSGSYMSAFAFTSAGDLYVANCGSSGSAGIDVYSTSRSKFGANLKPSLLYSNADIQGAGCAWGIAIH
jgi:sugar lactone lactonase YvrE